MRRQKWEYPLTPTVMPDESYRMALIEVIDQILCESDPLIAKLKAATSTLTDAEFKQTLQALDRLESRVARTRVELV
jgi:hypothetical protein